MKNIGDILVGIAVAVVAVGMIIIMVLLGLDWFQLTGAIVAGVVTLAVELLIYKNWDWIEENLLQPIIVLAVAGWFLYACVWPALKWIWGLYLVWVAGLLVLDATAVGIAIIIGFVVLYFIVRAFARAFARAIRGY